MDQGIRLRVLAITQLPLFLLAGVLGYVFISARIDDARLEMENLANRYADYLAVASELSVAAGDNVKLSQFAEDQLNHMGVATALVFVDSDARMLAVAGDPSDAAAVLACIQNDEHCYNIRDRMPFQKDIYLREIDVGSNPEWGENDSSGSQTLIGRLAFTFDTAQLASLQQKMLKDGLWITIIAALVAGVLAIYLANGITRPIVNLSRVVKDIRQGNMNARTSPSGRGELLKLELGINEMAAQVEQSKESLQLKVEKATQELLQTLSQLEMKNKALEEAIQRAESAGKAKALFLARMSHELRTPLSSIIGYLNLMKNSATESQRNEYSDVLTQASKVLLTTIDDILDFIRLEEEDVKLEKLPFDLRSCLKNVTAMQAPAARAKGLDLRCKIDTSVPGWVLGDEVRLAQIISNLLSNAIKFTYHGYVKLRATACYQSTHKAQLQIQVIDTGIGIPKDKQHQLFKPFVQAEDDISRRFGGSGLGLSIAYRLARSMNGDIQLESDVGQGVAITVKVMVERTDARPEPEPLERLPTNLELPASCSVLVVEDDQLSRRLIELQLKEFDLDVTSVPDGEMALKEAQSKTFDFALMDVHMPGMDGVSLAPALHELQPALRVYALTANVTGSEEEALCAAGVRAILYKPLSVDKIQGLIDDREARAPGGERTVIGSEFPLTQDANRIEAPRGIKTSEVVAELVKLMDEISTALAQDSWESVAQSAHKLLGTARLFCRGPMLEIVSAIDRAAKDQDASTLHEGLESLPGIMDFLLSREAVAARQ